MKTKPRWYRKFELDVSREKVAAVIANCITDTSKYTVTTLAGPYTPPDSDGLVGQKLVFRGEGHVCSFEFKDLHAMRFSEDGGEEKECYSVVKTMDDEVYFVNQLIPGYELTRQITLIADMKSGSATVCDARIGTEHSNIDVQREFIFGKLDGDFAGGPLHGFTDGLVGKAINWDYGNVIIKHIYSSNLYYTYSHDSEKYGAWMATNPADYVKIRDNMYIFSFIEERQHGLQGLFLINTDTVHDVGCFYGVNDDHMVSGCFGAKGEYADILTVF